MPPTSSHMGSDERNNAKMMNDKKNPSRQDCAVVVYVTPLHSVSYSFPFRFRRVMHVRRNHASMHTLAMMRMM